MSNKLLSLRTYKLFLLVNVVFVAKCQKDTRHNSDVSHDLEILSSVYRTNVTIWVNSISNECQCLISNDWSQR